MTKDQGFSKCPQCEWLGLTDEHVKAHQAEVHSEARTSNERVSISVEGSELMMELFNRMPVESLKAVPEPIQKRIGQFMVDNGYRFVFDRWFLQADPKAPERSAVETTQQHTPERDRADTAQRRACDSDGSPSVSNGAPLICYTPCKDHMGMPYTMKIGWSPPIKSVCPICHPPGSPVEPVRELSASQAAYREQVNAVALECAQASAVVRGLCPECQGPRPRHRVGCKWESRNGPDTSPEKATELPMCDCDPDFGCKEYDSKIFRCCQQEMEKRAAHLNGEASQ